MKKIIYLIVFLLIANLSFSQDKDVPFDKKLFPDRKEEFDNAVKEIKLGDLHFFRGSESDLSNALKHYVVADKLNHYSVDLNYKMGVCFLYSNKKFKALEHLEFVKKINPEPYPELDFYLAQAYQLDCQFDKAIETYQNYKSTINSNDQSQMAFINKKIAECRTGKELAKNPTRVWIDNLGPEINTEYPDYGPVISADNRVIFFTSRRPDSFGGEVDDTGYHYEDIYYSTREFDGEWETAKNIGAPVNTKSHDATVGLAPDGKSLLTYHGINRKSGNVLITRQDENGDWMQSKSLGENVNTKHHEEAASLSFDERTLFFVSNQPGGYGAHDIYVSYWDEEKQEWGPAQNLGPTVNTEYEEKGVFFHPDNKTLYFSSEGHKTMGGLDIFKTVYDAETGEWSKPENLGFPINTPDDDVYFVVSGNERFAYYSSYKADGYGEKDIYLITFLGPKKDPLIASSQLGSGSDFSNLEKSDKVEIAEKFDATITKEVNTVTSVNTVTTTSKNIVLSGKVVDGKTKDGLSSTITIVDIKSNKKVTDITTNADGTYSVNLEAGKNYAVTTSKEGYTLSSNTINTKKSDAGNNVPLNIELYKPTAGGTFVLRNIYFDFDKDDLRHKSVQELDNLVKVMKENPSMVIELGGHTDRRGSDEYNIDLSKRRAEVAKKYLINKGISADRIKTKGYGESQPEVSSEEINNMKNKREQEEAHQKNRRTVVTIISQ